MTTTARNRALKALSRLTAAEIESRLAELEAEAQALRTVLRSVKARDRVRNQASLRSKREATDAR